MNKEHPVVTIKHLTVAYDLQPVLWNVNLEIPRGRLMAVVGPNGAGKSTLIKAIMELLKPVAGEITFDLGEHLSKKEERNLIGYVPQNGSVDWDFPATVLDVVLMGRYGHLGWIKRPKEADYALSREMLKRVGMETYENRQISQLSGGQKQRVFLARALVQQPDIYFMDEPFQGVDAQTEKTIVALLKDLKKAGKTVVVVHHDLQTVPTYFDDVTLINREVIESGPVDKIFTEENLAKTYQKEANEAREELV